MKTLLNSLILIAGLFIQTAKADDTYRVTALKKKDAKTKSVSNEVKVKEFTLFIPNAFTPNADGLNDDFKVVGLGIIEFQLNIFARTGELIYTANEIANGWNGIKNGVALPRDIYVYTLTATTSNGTIISRNGTILLLL